MQISWYRYALGLAHLLSMVDARNELLVERAAGPISVLPSQAWDGVDGPWSSFAISVGTPAQDVRVFVSTASQDTFVVLPQGCAAGDTSCPSARGGIFNPKNSSTWSQYDYFELPIEQNLYGKVNGLFGNDTLSIGAQVDGRSLEKQVIGGIGEQRYYLGMLGVNPKPTKLSSGDSGQSSYITSLKSQNIIPSVSFGFTAGAAYQLKKVLGSLTLGGYDQSRFTPNDLSFSFAPDETRDLVVGIQSITSTQQNGTSSNLLPSGIMAYIDSTVPEIWLPVEACLAFEKAFKLTYDEKSSLYLVDEDLHDSLLAQNANVSFTLGLTDTGGETISITLPYHSFDLQVSPPVAGVDSASRYFPIRRAENDTQYTLGRTFFQEAYLIVDWERKNFSLSQCIFKDNSPQKLVAIEAAPAASAAVMPTPKASSGHGKTVGIAVGVTVSVVVVAVLVAVGFCLRRRRKPAAKANSSKSHESLANVQQRPSAKELIAKENAIYEVEGPDRPQNVQTNTPRPLPPWAPEKGNFSGDMMELTEDRGVPDLSQSEPLLGLVPEMYGSSTSPVELPANSLGELPAGSRITRNVSSAGSSSSNRRSRGFFSSRSSTPGFLPSPASGASPPNPVAGGQPTSDPPTTSSPPGNEVFSPISPIAERENPTSQGRGISIFRRFSQPGQSSQQAPDDRHPGHDHV
ncbi:hypothetical protein MMC29_002230 [Sticta canariensis]|nr:hypothetical protein [Sticta canariensis]